MRRTAVRDLRGRHIIVAGAGLAGLVAARDLEACGARVTVIEARNRIGGRVHTLRGLPGGVHAEAGADVIEAEQTEVLDLARSLRLKPERILRAGFGFYGPDRAGRRRIFNRPRALEDAARLLKQEVDDYCRSGKRWDSAIARALARESVADWLRRVGATRQLEGGITGLRGFFLADPEHLSLLQLVDQYASGGAPGESAMYRIRGGNDRLAEALAQALARRPHLNAILRSVRRTATGVRLTVERNGARDEMNGDYLVSALPATTVRDVTFTPALPDEQQRAFAQLKYGCATRVVLQFARAFWRKPGRPRAFGTDLPVGALWDGAEGQRGANVLTLLAGGSAASQLRRLVQEGSSLLESLSWLGTPARVRDIQVVTWEADPWARGGYAYFDPGFDPSLRAWLARPAGRVVFAGEHTSVRWQGFMSGAIESGRRAAAEVRYLASL